VKFVAYRLAAITMTLSDLEGHSLVASLNKCDFSYSCAAVGKSSTDTTHGAVPVR